MPNKLIILEYVVEGSVNPKNFEVERITIDKCQLEVTYNFLLSIQSHPALPKKRPPRDDERDAIKPPTPPKRSRSNGEENCDKNHQDDGQLDLKATATTETEATDTTDCTEDSTGGMEEGPLNVDK